jgi:hypothetical protein
VALVGRTFFALCAVAAVVCAWHFALPRWKPVAFQVDGGPQRVAPLPLILPRDGTEIVVHGTLAVPLVHPVLFTIQPDDCLTSLTINGVPVPVDQRICWNTGSTVWLTGRLHRGDNALDFRIRNDSGPGGLRMGVSVKDPLFVCTLLLLFAVTAAYVLSMGGCLGRRAPAGAMILIIAATFAARVPWVFSAGYGDLGLITDWGKSAVQLGAATSYARQLTATMLPNYPPLSLLLFEGMGRAYRCLLSPEYDTGLIDCAVFMKLGAIAADALTAALLMIVVRKLNGRLILGMAAGLVYAFHPAVIYDSAVWGQVDAVYACLAVASLVGLLYDMWAVTGACLALALLAKMQAVVILPAVATMCLLDRRAWWRLPLGMAVVAAIVVLPFLTPSGIQGMREVYLHSTGFYPVLSKNGYNAWVALFGLDQTARSDSSLLLGFIRYRTLGLALFAVCACGLPVACACRFRRALRDPAQAAVIFAVPALTAYAFFLANTEMHERYLFPLMPLGLPLAFISARGAWSYAAASALFFLNLLGVLPWTGLDRALYRELPNLPACIGVCHVFVFGHLALCLSTRVMGPWTNGISWPRLDTRRMRLTWRADPIDPVS